MMKELIPDDPANGVRLEDDDDDPESVIQNYGKSSNLTAISRMRELPDELDDAGALLNAWNTGSAESSSWS